MTELQKIGSIEGYVWSQCQDGINIMSVGDDGSWGLGDLVVSSCWGMPLEEVTEESLNAVTAYWRGLIATEPNFFDDENLDLLTQASFKEFLDRALSEEGKEIARIGVISALEDVKRHFEGIDQAEHPQVKEHISFTEKTLKKIYDDERDVVKHIFDDM